MDIKFTKLDLGAIMPTKAHPTDAGYDLTAISKYITEDYIEYDTGICIEIPDGYFGAVFPRSSISNKDLLLCNSVGIIDSNYRGTIKLRFKKTLDSSWFKFKTLFGFVRKVFVSHDRKEYETKDRIGQLVILPSIDVNFIETDTLSKTDRDINGFGSTDKIKSSNELPKKRRSKSANKSK